MSYACPKNLTGERIKPEKEKKKKKRKGQRYIICNNSLFIFSYIIFIVHHQLYLFVFTTQYHLLFTNISCSDDLYDSGSDDESYSQPTKRYAFLISPPLPPPFTAIKSTHHFFILCISIRVYLVSQLLPLPLPSLMHVQCADSRWTQGSVIRALSSHSICLSCPFSRILLLLHLYLLLLLLSTLLGRDSRREEDDTQEAQLWVFQ